MMKILWKCDGRPLRTMNNNREHQQNGRTACGFAGGHGKEAEGELRELLRRQPGDGEVTLVPGS